METMTFGEYVRLGACHGGYVIGLLAALGGFAVVAGIVITAAWYLVGREETKEEDE